MIEIPQKIRKFRFIKTKEKIPIETDWVNKNNYDYDNTTYSSYLKTNTTYGVLCGLSNLIVIDLDNKEIQEELMQDEEFKNTFIVKTAGSGLYHFYFIANKPPKSFKCLDADKNTILDAQGLGKQVIGAGSTLTNGRMYSVVQDVPIKTIDYDKLKHKLSKYDYNKLENKLREQKTNSTPSEDPLVIQIKQKMKIKDLLGDLGITTRKNPTDCPFHSSKGGKCFSYTDEVFFCFHCDEKGDLFHLYQKYHNVDFITAKNRLIKELGLNKELKITKKEEKSIKSKEALESYKEIDLNKFVIYKSKDETIYKLFISNFFITLTPDTILGSGDFRKKFFNETGRLLNGIDTSDWIDLINNWMTEKGQMIDHTKDVNTDSIILETVISEVQHFAVVFDPLESTIYGRMLYIKEEPNFIYVCNKVIDIILRKNQFKMNLSKLRVLLDEHLEGKSKVFRVGKEIKRFFRFRLEMLPEVIIEIPEVESIDN